MATTVTYSRKRHLPPVLILGLLIVLGSLALVLGGGSGAAAQSRALGNGLGNAHSILPQSCSTASFAPAVAYPAGGSHMSIYPVDINLDGYPDFVTGNTASGNQRVNIIYGNALGGFNPPVIVAPLVSPWGIDVADLNGDGRPDIVFTDFNGGTMRVLLNIGSGSFQLQPSITVGSLPDSILVANLNNDTFPDVAVSNYGSNSVSVLLGNGQGGFTSNQTFAVGSAPQLILVGDFNNDNNPDLTIANYGSANVSLLLGNGAGSFSNTNYYAGSGAANSVVGDFNSDGFLDTVVAYNQGASVLLNDGTGHLGAPTFYPGNIVPGIITKADFNLDGHLDVALGSLTNGTLSVLLNNGTGGFGAPAIYLVSGGNMAAIAADMNRDGRSDLIGFSLGNGTASILLNTCNGSVPTATPQASPTACTAGVYSDVPSGSTYYPYVTCLANRNIVGGYSDCTFRPGNSVTRGQLSKIVSLAANFTENHTEQTFQDVAVGSTFHLYVERLASRAIIGGYACGGSGEPCVGPGNKPYFRAANNITRSQISKIVAIAKGLPAPTPGQQTFQDVPTSSTFWQWIEELSTAGAIGGYPCGGAGEPCGAGNKPYFRAANNVTRGQSSKIVANTFFPGCSSQKR